MQMTHCVEPQHIQAWYDAWNRRDWNAIESLLAQHFVLEDMVIGAVLHGKAQYLRYGQRYAARFPDCRLKIDRILTVPSGYVVVEYRGEEKMRFCDILKYEHGKLVSCRTYGDPYRQLVDFEEIPRKKAA